MCDECRAGDHSNHVDDLAGICVGCACTIRKARTNEH